MGILHYNSGHHSFDNDNSQLVPLHFAQSAAYGFNAATDRFGSAEQAWFASAGFGNHQNYTTLLNDASTIGYNELWAGWWQRLPNTNNTEGMELTFTTPQSKVLCVLRTSGSTGFGLYSNTGTKLSGTPTAVPGVAVWAWIEAHIVFSTSTGSCAVKINNRFAFNVTGIDNAGASTSTGVHECGKINFGVRNSQDNQNNVDDFLVWTSTGGKPNGWNGPMRIYHLTVDSDGSTQNWTPSTTSTAGDYTYVNSTGSLATADNTWITSTSTGTTGYFGVKNSTYTMGEIYAVTPAVWHSVASVDKVSVGVKTTSTQSSLSGLDTSQYWRQGNLLYSVPGSTAAWGSTDLDNLQIVIRHG